MYSVSGNKIIMSRGDTVKVLVTIKTRDDEPYEPKEGELIRFFCKKYLSDRNYVFEKDIPISTQILTINPDDTSNLAHGNYFFDIRLFHKNGEVDTFIDNAQLKIIP